MQNHKSFGIAQQNILGKYKAINKHSFNFIQDDEVAQIKLNPCDTIEVTAVEGENLKVVFQGGQFEWFHKECLDSFKKVEDMQDKQEEIQVEEFIPNKEYPIGGYFQIGKEVFKVIKDTENCGPGCENCEFFDTIPDHCSYQACCPYFRKDQTSVVFILFDTEE